MEKFSYNSYPDSAESSPRSRDVDFDNPPPWEEQQQQQQTNSSSSYKVKFMCSYGGKIQPRPHDNQLTYVNGDTKILSVDRGIRFTSLASKLSAIVGGDGGGEISFKYQLPGEDLDALISVTNEDDLEHMMHEYDRLLRMSSKPARMRLFLFPSSPVSAGGFGSEGSTKSDRETLNINTIPNRPESEKSVTAPVSNNNADFLFGSEKGVVSTPPAPTVPQQIIQDPQMFVNQQAIAPELTPGEIQRQIQEFQRIQIRDQELHLQQQMQQQQQLHQQQQQQQQQEAMYRRKSEDGRYFSPTYAQNPPPQQQPPTTTVSQANQQGYWQGNNNNNNVPGNNNIYTTEQQVYMIPAQSQAPGTIYHSVMRPPPPTQGNQGYFQQRVQQHHPDPYMEQQQNSQQGYNVVQQPPQATYSGGPQVMSSGPMGIHETQAYSQMGNPVYYTVAGDGMMVPPQPQPHQGQYQGMGQPVSGMTGPDGKVVVNTAPKVSQSSDSV